MQQWGLRAEIQSKWSLEALAACGGTSRVMMPWATSLPSRQHVALVRSPAAAPRTQLPPPSKHLLWSYNCVFKKTNTISTTHTHTHTHTHTRTLCCQVFLSLRTYFSQWSLGSITLEWVFYMLLPGALSVQVLSFFLFIFGTLTADTPWKISPWISVLQKPSGSLLLQKCA